MPSDITNDFSNIIHSFGIKADCVDFQQVDGYFYYDLKLLPHGKVNDLKRRSDEISLALHSSCKPGIKILHHEGIVRLEFAENKRNMLNLFDLFSNRDLPKGDINCLLGQLVNGQKVWMDLAQNPHMLIAGTTGSGKSTLLHTIIANLFNYNDVELYLIDPKRIEFAEYQDRCGTFVGYTYVEAMDYLTILHDVMEFRYDQIRAGHSVAQMKHVVMIVDEFADLMMQDQEDAFKNLICRLAQKCRAARIHLILSTQRPSTNFISGSIKANFPARIACRVPSHVDSKVILDSVGAENLLGNGDALLRDNFRHIERFQIAYTTPQEVCNYFGNNAK